MTYLDDRVSAVIGRAEGLSRELTVTVAELAELLQTYKAKVDEANER